MVPNKLNKKPIATLCVAILVKEYIHSIGIGSYQEISPMILDLFDSSKYLTNAESPSKNGISGAPGTVPILYHGRDMAQMLV